MVRSLFFKLIGAFALVILALAAVVTVLANQATADQFRAYTDRSGQLWAQQLAPALSNYYSSSGTWQGVSASVQDPVVVAGGTEGGIRAPASPAGSATSVAQPGSDRAGGTEPDGSVVALTPTSVTGADTTIAPVAAPAAAAGMGRGRMGPGMMGAPPNVAPAAELPQRMGPGVMMTPNPGPSSVPGALASSELAGQAGMPSQGTPGSSGTGGAAGQHGMMGFGLRGAPGTAGQSLADMWTMMGQRVIVADATGQVVSDSAGSLQDKTLSAQQLEAGAPIQVAGQPAGTVLVTSGDVTPASLAGQFLAGVNRSILVAVLAAGALSMGLGGLLFFQITAPLRKLKAAAVGIAGGDLTQRVSVRTRDELGDLAQTFNSMAESLALAEAERRHMVADVAHELRTPLSVMQANLEAMQDGVLPLDAEQIASLHEETVLLSRLVADLRLLSLAEAGQLKLERTEVNPDDLIRKAAERLYRKAEERGVALKVETVAPLPVVSVDVDRISQVVGNLVSNALRYTPAGGSVTVQVKPEVDHPEADPRRWTTGRARRARKYRECWFQ